MSGRTRWLHTLSGPEWLLLLGLVPLTLYERPTTFTHAALVGVLLLILAGAFLLRNQLGRTRLAVIAWVALLPVLAVALAQAGRAWSSALLLIWSGGFAWYLIRNRPLVRPGTGPVVWLVLVSVTWALVFLIVADLFLGGVTASAATRTDRLLGVLLVLSLFSAVILGLTVWWQRRETPVAAAATAFILLAGILLLEGSDAWRLWHGARQVDRLVANGSYGPARARLDRLMKLGDRKGRGFVYPDLLLLSARVDAAEGKTGPAMESLMEAAQTGPDEREQALRTADAAFLTRFFLLPPEERNRLRVFTDLELDAAGFLLLDRWGRVLEVSEDPPGVRFAAEETVPYGRTAVDLEIVNGGAGMLVLDDGGSVTVCGDVGPELGKVVAGMSHPLRGAIDLEIAGRKPGFYVVDGFGDLAAYGTTGVLPEDNPHHWDDSVVRDMEVCPNDTGVVLLDGYGSVHPAGIVPFELKSPDAPYWFEDVARALEFWPSGLGLSLLTRRGEWGSFGQVPDNPRKYLFPSYEAIDYEIDPSGRELAVLGPGGTVEVLDLESKESREITSRIALSLTTGEREPPREAPENWSPPPEFDAADLAAAAAMPLLSEDLPDLVARAIPGDEPGTLFVLDRRGRIWRWKDGSYGLISAGPQEAATAEAVAMVRCGGGFAVLDRAGMLRSEPRRDDARGPFPAGEFTMERYPVDLVAQGQGFLVLDCFGRVTPVDLSGAEIPPVPEVFWGFAIARRLQVLDGAAYILDGLGGIHAPGNVKGPRTNGAAYYSRDLVRDFEPVGDGFYTMDFAGGMSRTDGASPILDPHTLPADLRAFAEKAGAGVAAEPEGAAPKVLERAVDLVYDPRDGSFFVLFRNGRVFVIRTG